MKYASSFSVRRFAGRTVGRAAMLLAGMAACASAFAVDPTLEHILPRGAQRGTETPVTFTGGNLGDAVGIVFHEPGISYKDLVVEEGKVKATLVIAPDCRVGLQGMRVQTKTGISNLRIFSVGNLTEIQEAEPNNPRENAPVIALNTTINGVVEREDEDYYAVELTEGQRLAVEVEALRLGRKLFDPKLRLFSPDGHELLAEDDTQLFRQDAGFVHHAEKAGTYLVAVSEASYGGAGDYYYRLHLGNFPRPFAMTPLGGTPGSEVEVKFLGDPDVDVQKITLPAADSGASTVPVQTDAGVAPTELPVRLTEYAGVQEVEPNNTREEATPGAVVGAFDGVISEPGDVDFFSFEGKKDAAYSFRVWARELGSPLDSVLNLLGPDGKGVAGSDDGAGIDSSFDATLPADGVYTLRVRDHLDRGGETFAYRVEVFQAKPSVNMRTLENDDADLTVPQDNQSYLLMNVARRGFDAPIKAEFQEMPAGLTPTMDIIPAGETTRPVIITAAPDAPVAASLAQVMGIQQDAEQPITGGFLQELVMVYGRNETTFYGRNVERLAVAVAEPAPFKATLVAPAAPIVHKGFRMLTVNITRAEGFEGEVSLSFPWLPSGMSGGTAKIAADQTSAQIRLEVKPGTAVGTHQIFVAAHGAGYRLCTPFTPVEVQDEWVSFALNPIETEQGKPTELVVAVEQKTPFEGTFPVQLAGLPKGVTSEEQQLSTDVSELRFPLTVAEDAPVGKFGSLHARSNIIAAEEEVVHVSGSTELKIYEPLPEELQAKTPEPAQEESGEPKAEEPERKTRFPTT